MFFKFKSHYGTLKLRFFYLDQLDLFKNHGLIGTR